MPVESTTAQQTQLGDTAWRLPVMQACNRQGAYCVPLYDSLGEDAIEYIVGHASCYIVFVASLKFPGFVEALPRLTHVVKTVVVWDTPDQISIQVQ